MHTVGSARVIAGPALTLALLVVASLAAGCSAGPLTIPVATTSGPLPSEPVPSEPVPSGLLVTIETRGGMCVGGPCAGTVFLERDGHVHQAAKPPNDLGIVPAAALAALDAAIRATDFTALKSHPFSGQCPTAFDGQEIIFEFGAPGGVERISTCEVEVDFESPLFVAVSTALGSFVPLDGGATPP
jgi:hypothetical protein